MSWDGISKEVDRLLAELAEAERLKAENKELRELARHAIMCAAGEADCATCPYGKPLRSGGATCEVEAAAHELRVDVG